MADELSDLPSRQRKGGRLRNTTKAWKLTKAREMRLAMTGAEAILWDALRGKSLGVRVRRQSVVRGYIADFWIPKWNLVVEVDGGYHLQRRSEDAKRDSDLMKIGIWTVRFRNEDVLRDLAGVIAKIKAHRPTAEMRQKAAFVPEI